MVDHHPPINPRKKVYLHDICQYLETIEGYMHDQADAQDNIAGYLEGIQHGLERIAGSLEVLAETAKAELAMVPEALAATQQPWTGHGDP